MGVTRRIVATARVGHSGTLSAGCIDASRTAPLDRPSPVRGPALIQVGDMCYGRCSPQNGLAHMARRPVHAAPSAMLMVTVTQHSHRPRHSRRRIRTVTDRPGRLPGLNTRDVLADPDDFPFNPFQAVERLIHASPEFRKGLEYRPGRRRRDRCDIGSKDDLNGLRNGGRSACGEEPLDFPNVGNHFWRQRRLTLRARFKEVTLQQLRHCCLIHHHVAGQLGREHRGGISHVVDACNSV